MATDVRKDIPDNYKYGWYDADAKYTNEKKRGLDEAVIRDADRPVIDHRSGRRVKHQDQEDQRDEKEWRGQPLPRLVAHARR